MPVARAFAVMVGGEAAWALFEAMELVIVPLPMKEWCFAPRAGGAVTMILGLLATVLLYTGNDRWVRPDGSPRCCALAGVDRPGLDQPVAPSLLVRVHECNDRQILDRDAGLRPGIQGPLRVFLRAGRGRDGPDRACGIPVARGVPRRPRSCSSACCCRGL